MECLLWDNITQPNTFNYGAEFDAVPVGSGGLGQKLPLFFWLGGALLDLLRGLLG